MQYFKTEELYCIKYGTVQWNHLCCWSSSVYIICSKFLILSFLTWELISC